MRRIIKFFFLKPISRLWENIYRFRRAMYNYRFKTPYSFKVPVISVGNISFGGTGKTPFTIWLIDYLNSLNKTTFVLSRGYKGKLENETGLIFQEKSLVYDPSEYGDEPLILAKKIQSGAVAVGKDRVQNLKRYFNKVKPDMVILDDGFQYLNLTRNINVVLFDSLMDLNLYQPPPLGYLREGIRSLSDADVICLTRSDLVNEEKIMKLKDMIKNFLRPDVIFLETIFTPTGFFNGQYGLELNTSEIQNKKLVAMCGLASPNSFYQMLEAMGGIITRKVTLKDHHCYTRKEIMPYLDLAKKEDALIVTTEKDMIKIRKLVMSEKLLFLGIKVEFRKGEDELKGKINKTLGLSI